MTSPDISPSVKPQSWFKRWRGWLIALLIIVGCIAAWFGFDYWQAVADERALQEYLAELDQREPNWRERVYGKEATEAQAESRRKINELVKSSPTYNPAWVAYREGLYQGMYSDPAHPAARLPEEQVEFLNWSREYWKPFRDKSEVVDTLVPLNRYLLKDEPYEKMIALLQQDLPNLWMVNEPIELETMYYIDAKNPKEAAKWLRRGIHVQLLRHKLWSLHQLDTIPFFVERLLNLTEADRQTLEQLQHDLETASHTLETETYLQFGAECRLYEKTIRDISRGELKYPQLERTGVVNYLIPEGSAWNYPSLQFLRTYYLEFKVRQMYHRHNQITLKLHQLADQVEALASLPEDKRWSTWKSFAVANGIPLEAMYPNQKEFKTPNTEAFPDGVFYLVPYPSVSVLFALQKEVQMKTAIAAVAAERFRLDHGRFPREWSELVPRYLSKEMVDPFSGKPLVIKEIDKGIVIYSTGKDGKDKGGENLSSNHYPHYGGKGWDWKKTNIGTRVYLPQFRRSEPIQLNESQKEGLNKWREFEAEQKKKAEQGNK